MTVEQTPPETGMPGTAPRPFDEIPALWLKVFEMTEDFFAREVPRASSSTTLIGVLVYSAAGAVLSNISVLISRMLSPGQAAIMTPSSVFCSSLFGGVIGFYLGSGVLYLCARTLGGNGDFTTQAYLQMLYLVPIGIVSSLLSFIPFVNCVAGLAIMVFSFVMSVRCIKVVHNLETLQAVIASILLPLAAFILFAACFVLIFISTLGPVMGDVILDFLTQ